LKKIGLALGSGGARGWAHIGVVDALEEAGISVQCVAGTSMGALVGGAFASGRIRPLKEVALRLDWKRTFYYFLEVTFPRSGLIDGVKIADFVRQHVAKSNVQSLRIPFAAVATDILTGRAVVIETGDMIEAIRASISMPGILTPVTRDGVTLVDGCLVDPVPVGVARKLGATFVIAVDLNYGAVGDRGRPRARRQGPAVVAKKKAASKAVHTLKDLLQNVGARIEAFDFSMLTPARKWMSREEQPNVFDVLGNSMRIMETQITDVRLKLDPPDILIRPAVGHLNFMEFHRADEIIRAGYTATKERISEIRALALRR
jgi:NTE family protein